MNEYLTVSTPGVVDTELRQEADGQHVLQRHNNGDEAREEGPHGRQPRARQRHQRQQPRGVQHGVQVHARPDHAHQAHQRYLMQSVHQMDVIYSFSLTITLHSL